MRPTGWLLGLCVALSAVSAGAQSPAVGDGRCRAGDPENVAPWAHPSDTGRYTGYYVGGGSPRPRKADLPYPDEGTWGWDYVGGCIRRHVILGWWHDRRCQGGIGAYQTDGPKVLHPLDEGHE